MNARVYIGTSGWNYRHWRKRFYPEGLRQADWLSHFADRFDSVEINNAFYRIPEVETIETWQRKTPSRFRFAMKMWRGVSHYKKLKNCGEHLEKYFASVQSLSVDQRGPILLQLPSNQGKDIAKLEQFIRDFKTATRPARWKLALEFRRKDWLCGEVFRLLDRSRVALCLHDMPPAAVSEPNDAAFVYVRRHGPTGDYRGAYSDRAIDGDAEGIRRWRDQGKSVFVYFNNDDAAHAPRDAERLRNAVGE